MAVLEPCVFVVSSIRSFPRWSPNTCAHQVAAQGKANLLPELQAARVLGTTVESARKRESRPQELASAACCEDLRDR